MYAIFSVWYEMTCQEEKSVRGRKVAGLLIFYFLGQSSTYIGHSKDVEYTKPSAKNTVYIKKYM